MPAKHGGSRPGREIILYTAQSLDGFIATKDGGIDWLFHDQDYGFKDFFASVEAVLVGRKTFDHAQTLAEDPFGGKQTYVFTRSGRGSHASGVEFIRDDPAAFTRAFKGSGAGAVWLVGGGEINGILMKAGLVDRMELAVHPVVLGVGRPLFGVETGVFKFALEKSKIHPNGLAQLSYRL